MRIDGNQGSKLAYEPNSFGKWQDQPEFIKIRHIGNCDKADPEYGAGVAKAMGINPEEENDY